jgi:broad specificity phosphatase PhoE
VLYQDWQAGRDGFEFPAGEARAAFQVRVGRVVERLLAGRARFVAGVLHKGVIREIARQLTGEAMPKTGPALGELVTLTRVADGPWLRGVRSSDPPGLAASA